MKVYSPSSTSTFLACRTKYLLYKQGWLPRTYNKGSVYAIRGSGVSAGLDVLYTTGSEERALLATKDAVQLEWQKARINEREWSEFKSLPLTLDEVVFQAQNLVSCYVETPIDIFDVLHTEYIFANHGNARADLVVKMKASGNIIPVDFKTKDVPYNAFYAYTTKQDYRFSFQMMHYVWAVSQEFNVDCREFGIILLWHDKKCNIEYVPFGVDSQRLALWYESAVKVWEQMEACENGEEPFTEAANHRDQYGPCEYSKLCLEYNRNYTLAQQDYLLKDVK